MSRKIRFPFVSLAAFMVFMVVSWLVWRATEAHCAFGFGGFQCNEPVRAFKGFLLFWSLLSLVLIPGSFGVAVWRVVRWYRNFRLEGGW